MIKSRKKILIKKLANEKNTTIKTMGMKFDRKKNLLRMKFEKKMISNKINFN